jgi:histidyl-tRNA synthetase
MRDFLPADVRRRQHVIDVIGEVYQRYGFEPLETPAAENIDTLTGKYGEEGDRLIFRILKRGEEGRSGDADLALRYDLTVPLARVVAEYRSELPKFFKRYQVQPVWRADRPQKGRFREFYQCDVDFIGSTSAIVEAEVIAAVSDVLLTLGFGDFEIELNHRQVLESLVRAARISTSRQGDAVVALDKLDKIGRDGVRDEFRARGIDESAGDRLLDWVSSDWSYEFLQRLDATLPMDDEGKRAAANLAEIVRLSQSTSASAHLRLNPALARGLSYYTGAIFEARVKDLAGSLGGGGRYDNLIGMFLGQPVPAAGFSLGLERILVVMAERGMFPDSLVGTPADVMVTIWRAESAPDAIRLAGELRTAGLRVDVYPEPDKLGKQFKYADGRGVRFVAVVGDEEAARGEVTIKDLRTGDQLVTPRTALPAHLRQQLEGVEEDRSNG